MNPVKVRSIHRRLGIGVACFLIVQAIAGMFMGMGRLASLDTSALYNVLYTIHAGWNPFGSIYRVALGFAATMQVILGIMLFLNRFRHQIGGRATSTVPLSPNQPREVKKEAPMATLSFATDIRPLFRDKDINGMRPNGIDLSSYEDVKKRIRDIYARLSAKEMPCDGQWSENNQQKLKEWIEGGMEP